MSILVINPAVNRIGITTYADAHSNATCYCVAIYLETRKHWMALDAHNLGNCEKLIGHLIDYCQYVHSSSVCHDNEDADHVHTDIPTLLFWLKDVMVEIAM